MVILHQDGVRIAGICACVPKNAVRNEAKVAEATGIRARRIAAEGTTVVDATDVVSYIKEFLMLSPVPCSLSALEI